METQYIIVYIIIALAIIYTIHSIVAIIRKKEQSGCNCSSCDLKSKFSELKKINTVNKIQS